MDESCFVLLSALQHYAFCPRQCALIHVERLWQENVHTMEGALMHKTAHSGQSRVRDGMRIATDVSLCCRRVGITGAADIVEFHRDVNGEWQPFPVEYKKGRPHGCDADAVQLCGQALCLEEMLSCTIPEGALFYGSDHRRHTVPFTPALRQRTEAVAKAVHELMEQGITPPAVPSSFCMSCSLAELCMPKLSSTASVYLRELCEET